MCRDGITRCPFCDKDISELVESYYETDEEYEVPPKWGYDQDSECPLCHESYDIIPKDGVRNTTTIEQYSSEWDETCPHWFCCICLDKMCENGVDQCPFCDKDISELVDTHYECVYGSDEDEDEDDNMK
jgi:hypothetical protein